MTTLILPLLLTILTAPPENPAYSQLIEQGVPADLAGKTRVKLPPPSMADGLDAAAQRRMIEEVAGPNRRLDLLLRNTVVAPLILKIDDLPAVEGSDPLRRVDVWYVAYGKLEQFFEEELFAGLVELASGEKKSRLPVTRGVLKEEQLRQRSIQIADAPDRKERYCYGTFDLFDRVLLSTTRRVVATRQAESVLVAAVIDPRFTDDAKYPNAWRAVEMDQQRNFKLGKPQPYVASGSYTKVTRLHDPAGALLIEHHYLFAEPTGWFKGTNQLRAKLPLAVQDSVRKLRQQLRAANLKDE